MLNGTSQLKKGNVKPGTPLLQYVGLKISHTTQSPKLIDDIYHVGLSVKLRFQSYVIHNCSFILFLEKVSSMCDLKITLMLTQKQISTNQVTMGLFHL